MRRRCFFFTAVLIVLIFLTDSLGVELRRSSLEQYIGKEHSFTGCVKSVQQSDSGKWKLEVLVDEGEKVLLTFESDDEYVYRLYNMNISFETELKNPQGRRNPGCFDYSRYLKSRNIFKTGYVVSVNVEKDERNPWERFTSFLIERRFEFQEKLNPQSKGIICGVLFGDTTFLDDNVYENFQQNGTAHVLAVSGLHVGILYSVFSKITGERKSIPAIILLTVFLISYATLSMWTPSVTRACMMIGIKLTAKIMDLRYDMLTGLSTVALVLIMQNPYAVFGTGFQMSFMAIASICFLNPLMSMKIPDEVAVMISVNAGLLVYQMYQFNYISLVSLFINIPIIYLTGILVPAALLSFAVFIITDGGYTASLITDSLSFLLTKLNDIASLGGYGSIEVTSPPLIVVLSIYFVVFFMASEYRLVLKLREKKREIRRIIAVLISFAAVISVLNYCPVSRDDVVFVDVGQGDCVHIRCGGSDVLIDGGGSVNYNVGKNTLKPYLLKNGAGDIDMAVVTHLHTDHFKGIEELAEVFDVKAVKSGLIKGTVIEISDDVWLETLWPLSISADEGQDKNHQCSVFMLHYEGCRILITGDLDEEGERMMLAEYAGTDVLNADIIKVGHHGSSSSSCEEFIEAVSPEAAVIQVGENNLYGHPAAKVIERYEKNGIIVYRNDYHGAVGFRIKKDGFSAHTTISN